LSPKNEAKLQQQSKNNRGGKGKKGVDIHTYWSNKPPELETCEGIKEENFLSRKGGACTV